MKKKKRGEKKKKRWNSGNKWVQNLEEPIKRQNDAVFFHVVCCSVGECRLRKI